MKSEIKVSFIGSVGLPNRYGGFESFLEHCAPAFASAITAVYVTCDSFIYPDKVREYNGVKRIFIPIPANGFWSIIHDLIAFVSVFRVSTHIVILGTSGGLWYPFFRILCFFGSKKIISNIAGVEWRRPKFNRFRQNLLWVFDYLIQTFSHVIIYDNLALFRYIKPWCLDKAVCIPYSGDHVIRKRGVLRTLNSALTVCRIEPENNIEMLIKGALLSGVSKYTIVGNWKSSKYGRKIYRENLGNVRLLMLDPIYDNESLAILRESCDIYLHGHSVGGTNPSLVEMLFYECHLVCFDVSFNRATVGDVALYFNDSGELARVLDQFILGNKVLQISELRHRYRQEYSRAKIVDQYMAVFHHS